jgi:hypothetical protein
MIPTMSKRLITNREGLLAELRAHQDAQTVKRRRSYLAARERGLSKTAACHRAAAECGVSVRTMWSTIRADDSDSER